MVICEVDRFLAVKYNPSAVTSIGVLAAASLARFRVCIVANGFARLGLHSQPGAVFTESGDRGGDIRKRDSAQQADGSTVCEMEVTHQATQELMVSGGFSLDTKEQVRQAIDIVDLVGHYIQLRRQGRGYVGLCPWHDDSRPSLQVNPERQSWKCWVCDIGGDIFSFIMKVEGIGEKVFLQLKDLITVEEPKK